MSDNLQNLNDIYDHFCGNRIVCLTGHKGFGKTTVLEEFLDGKKDYIQITNYDNDNYLHPVINGIRHYYHKHDIQFNTQLLNPEFTYEEFIIEEILKICSLKKFCIVLHSFTNFPPMLVDFIKRVISVILRKGQNCLIIIEIDTDDLRNSHTIYQFPNQEYIRFEPIDRNEMRDVILKENAPLDIDKKSLNYILDSAEQNPALLNIILNYLKSNGFLQFDGHKYICSELEVGLFSNILEDELRSRYERLDETMKNIFLKSSMFGMEFHANHLTDSFLVISANETLRQIESVSNLLLHKSDESDLFAFINDEAFKFAKTNIPDKQRIEWASILSRYYQTLWQKRAFNNLCNSCEDLALKVATYALEGGKYDIAYYFYIASFFAYFKENAFLQALSIMEKINQFPIKIQVEPILQIQLKELYALCCENVGDYTQACNIYKKAIRESVGSPYSDLFNLRYRLAFCTYYTSQVNHALELAEVLKQDLDVSDRDDALYYNLVSLLATLYREVAHPKTTEMFLLALNECKEKHFEYEYHVQLRKADLCYDVELSLPMVRSAAVYFKKTRYTKEYAKAVHNLGTDYLYTGDFPKARRNLMRSQKVFASFGSTDEVYAINCLGVWHAVVNEDYTTAISLFEEGLAININDFKQMTICANIAACYQKLQLFDKCQEFLHRCEEIPAKHDNTNIAFYRRTVLWAWAFYYKETGKYDLSLTKFRECLKIHLKKEQLFFTASCIVELCNIMGVQPTEKEVRYSAVHHNSLYRQYLNLSVLFHTLRFIE